VGAQGTATLDFGSTPSVEASVAVTGQAAILATSVAEAWVMGAITAGNDENAHLFAGVGMRLTCGIPVAGTGFTIYGTIFSGLADGTFTVQWAWL